MTELEEKSGEMGSGTTYINEIDKVETSDQPPEIKLDLLDILTKDYLRKRYHLRKNIEYEEMIEFFMQKSKLNTAAFCHEMIVAIYSGDLITMNNVSVLAEDAKSMIEREESSEKTIGSTIKKAVTPIIHRLLPSARKENAQSRKQENVSKQAKRIIDSYLEDKSKVIEEIKNNSVLAETQKDASLVYELNPALQPEQGIEESDELRSVRNIDDLERIKQKIKQRKIIIRKNSGR